MKKYLILFLLLKSILFGCSLCSIYSPRTHISTKIIADDINIKTINIEWTFAKEFSDQLLAIYDLDMDGTFNEKELKLIEDALVSYISTKNFLTTITYDNKIDGQTVLFDVKNYKMDYTNEILSFQYEISLDYKIYDNNFLKINIFDNEGYFLIVFENKKQTFNIPYEVIKDTNISEVTYKINAPSLPAQKDKISIEEMKANKILKNPKTKSDIQSNNTYLDNFTNNVKKYLIQIENGNKTASVFLLFASFLYGLMHAIGPGHGKTLVFSYFSTQKSSYFRAFIVSLLIAFIHIAGALFVVLVSMVVLKSVLNNFVENSITYTTALSSIIIIFLALYILYKKIKKSKHVCNLCGIKANEMKFYSILQNNNISYLRPSTISIPKKRTKIQDLIFVLCAGIIPCPGTVFLFIYAFLLETYFTVVLSSIFISLGMAVIIFCSSALSISMHKVSEKSSNILNILEIIAPILMIILAILLFLSTGII